MICGFVQPFNPLQPKQSPDVPWISMVQNMVSGCFPYFHWRQSVDMPNFSALLVPQKFVQAEGPECTNI
jgi:hypothetical protein